MNERIKELAGKANIHFSRIGILDGDPDGSARLVGYSKIEKFAELIVRECMEQVWYTREDKIDETISQNIKARMAKHFGVEE